ncbi:hypothetical protein ACOTTU_14935 [Roseobacter sp. EG26]|uniref:hypothetical protein n=1 Tax=Roseobacter sp. EG26 TaxID=3412477 RepID=UPI003CE4494A
MSLVESIHPFRTTQRSPSLAMPPNWCPTNGTSKMEKNFRREIILKPGDIEAVRKLAHRLMIDKKGGGKLNQGGQIT